MWISQRLTKVAKPLNQVFQGATDQTKAKKARYPPLVMEEARQLDFKKLKDVYTSSPI